MKITKRYLRLPVSRGQAGVMRLVENGKECYSFSVAYCPGSPEYDVYADMKPFFGQSVSVTYNGVPVEYLEQMESFSKDAEENCRPLIHFTAPWGWINDPNGLSFYAGCYHLFCQHNPFGDCWGNMHWGHATSTDLLHWEWKGDVLYPDNIHATMFSGSSVVDTDNTAGFGQNAQILIYTCADEENGFTQNLAYSTDGEHYRKYTGNPVLKNLAPGNRDPKVIWHPESRQWIMALYLEEDKFALFFSKNLKEWTELERISFPGANECPDFFPLTSPSGKTKWIFWEAGCRYLIGDFDGKHFSFENKVKYFSPRNAVTSAYAAQTFYGDPSGRRLMVFWEKIMFKGAGFTGQHSVPLELTLIEHNRELMISCNLPTEIKNHFSPLVPEKALWLKADLRQNLSLEGHRITYEDAVLTIDDECYPVHDPIVELMIDRASIEIFADNHTKFFVHEGRFSLLEKIVGAKEQYSILD